MKHEQHAHIEYPCTLVDAPMHTCRYASIYACHMHVCEQTWTCTHTRSHKCTNARLHVCLHARMFACTHVTMLRAQCTQEQHARMRVHKRHACTHLGHSILLRERGCEVLLSRGTHLWIKGNTRNTQERIKKT